MAKGLSPLKIGIPTLPPIPYPGQTNFHEWVAKLYTELEIYFSRMKDQLVDNRGFLQVATQVVEDGFTVVPSANYVDLHPEDMVTPVTSSADFAISVGVPGQALIISNTGGGTITIKHNAMTWMASLADVVLQPQTAIFMRWDSTTPDGVWTQVVMA